MGDSWVKHIFDLESGEIPEFEIPEGSNDSDDPDDPDDPDGSDSAVYPPSFTDRITCRLKGHLPRLVHFNHFTLQGRFLCLRCSRISTFDLATLIPDESEYDRESDDESNPGLPVGEFPSLPAWWNERQRLGQEDVEPVADQF